MTQAPTDDRAPELREARDLVRQSLKAGAPGLAEGIREAIVRSIMLKLEGKVLPKLFATAEARAREAEVRVERMEAALRPFCFGDPTLERILYDGMPDTAAGTFTISLGDIRRARAALSPTDPRRAESAEKGGVDAS